MGACCSTECTYKGRQHGNDGTEEREEPELHNNDNNHTTTGHNGAIIRSQGASSHTSMYTRKGKKGINQDAMTIWENFTGEKNTFFCGVFDGHGPSGHKVSRHVSEALPLKLSIMHQPQHQHQHRPRHGAKKESDKDNRHKQWEADFIKTFQELDEELSMEKSLDSYCSGSTAVTLVKQDHHLIIANLGDSRAILGTRDNKNQLIPVQLTVDLKPSIQSEAERIAKHGGRVFAMEEEPSVMRVWMRDQDCPGLAMSRALGDFCLKDHGLISTPQVFYRTLTPKDEFVVMATDGVWDVLSNNEVVQIVASVKRQSIAAKVLVYYAVQAWRTKYPGSKVDDCAVVCLFLKKRPPPPPTHGAMSDVSVSQIDLPETDPKGKKTEEGETVINSDITVDRKTLEEVSRANAYKRSRLGSMSKHKTSADYDGETYS